MVYPHEHVLLRFNGHFGSSGTVIADRWSVGLRFGLPGAAPAYDAAKLLTFVNAAQAAATTFHTNASTAAGLNTFFDQVTGAQIGVLGKYVPATQQTVFSPSVPTAGAGTASMPWNTAHVISLRTAIPRGRGSNGRMYWPMIAGSANTGTGRLTSSAVTNRVGAAKTFFDALNVAANTYSAGMKLVVASNVGSGLYATVTSIRADDRFDSIERRENDQPSTFQSATLV